MKKKPIRFGLEVSSFMFCGAMGAEHYYGEVWWEYKRAGCEKEKLTKPMSQKTATYLNKKDASWGCRYKKGDLTERFDTKPQLRQAAIRFLTEKFGNDIVIEEGSYIYSIADNEIIYKNVQ